MFKRIMVKFFNRIDPNSCPNHTVGCNGKPFPYTDGGITRFKCTDCGDGKN